MNRNILAAAVAVAALLTSASSYGQIPLPPNDRAKTYNLTAQGTCASGNAQSAFLSTQGMGSVGIVVTGTFVGTLTFKGAFDEKVTFNTVSAYPQAGGAAVTTATSTGSWFVKAAAYRWVCVYFSAYTSGTASIWMEASVSPVASFTGSDIATIGSAAVALGSTTASASLPVTIATDDGLKLAQASTTSGQTGPLAQTATTTAAPSYTTAKTNPLSTTTTGDLRTQAEGAVADGVAMAGNPVPTGHKAVADAAAPTQVTAGQGAYSIATLERIPIVTTRHPNHIQCQQATSVATSLTALGGSCAAPGAGLSIYITDIDFSTNAGGIAADSFNTLKSGTGGTCGAATAVIWQCLTPAATQATCSSHLQSPIKVTANSEVCWINSTAGTKTVNIEGYIAP